MNKILRPFQMTNNAIIELQVTVKTLLRVKYHIWHIV